LAHYWKSPRIKTGNWRAAQTLQFSARQLAVNPTLCLETIRIVSQANADRCIGYHCFDEVHGSPLVIPER
jgi:hypothetical protein